MNTSGVNWSKPGTQQNQPYTRPTCQICGRMGHVAFNCWNRFDNSYQNSDVPHALATMHISGPSGREWYPDSGASAHITNNSNNLQEVTP